MCVGCKAVGEAACDRACRHATLTAEVCVGHSV
jgi:hypothetical protein